MVEHVHRQKQSFEARLARIHDMQNTSLQPMRGGAPTLMQAKDTDAPKGLPKAAMLGFGVGLVAMLAANVVAFAYSGPQTNFFAETLGALGPYPIVGMILFVLMIGFGLRDKPHVIGIALGLPLMYFTEPYLATLAPDWWVQMYSADHVDQMLIKAGLRDPMLL
jgi:hypothetical protein